MEVKGNRFTVCCLLLLASCTFLTYQGHIHLRNPLTYLTCTYSLNRFYQNKTSQLGTKVAKATGFLKILPDSCLR